MAKKKQPDPKASTLARIKRTESYAEKIRKMFAETVNEILALNKTIPTLDTGVMFSFDDQSRKVRQKVEVLLRRLHSVATLAIQKGVTLEWEQANEECDKLVSSCFGKSLLSTPQMKAWAARNNAAKKAFLGRSEKGLNLSQRVWKTVQQLRDEMEVAITVAIGDGTSAASMSRSVRQYLNNPDLMFRRFRYKDPETGEWRRKWKKRIIDPATGKHKWIDYDRDSYRTGAGVYKSSAKNAMRVTRTETNIAYRRADHERWQDMDFVLGQRVSLSGDHPKKDICDKLAGDYPKDFVFDGWHPQCFCIVTPITLPPEETADLTKIMLEGGDWRKALRDKVRGREITTYPENFRSWVQDNAENIAAARDRGTEPYFIRNNAQAIDKILDPDKFTQETRKKTPQEIAAERHAARTPDEIADIKARAAARQERIAAEKKRETQITTTANNVLATADRRGFTSLGISIEGLTEAVKKGNSAEIREQTRLLALAMSAKQKVLRATAQNVSKVAADYGEVDTDELKAALASGNAAKINEATRAVGKSILEMKRGESAISDTLPNVHEWHKKFTLSEIQAAVSGVKSRMGRERFSSLAEKKRWLESEIKWVEDKKKYPTWQVAQDAYKNELKKVEREIEVEAIQKSVDAAILYAKTTSKDPALKSMATDMELALKDASVGLSALKLKATALNKKYQDEYSKVKEWLDLESMTKSAIDYASRSHDDKYKKLANEVSAIISARRGTITTANKKAEKLMEEYRKALGGGSTLKELEGKLGSNMPPTLQKLQKLIDKKSKAQGWTAEEEEEMRKKMLELFDNSDFGMNIPRLSNGGDDVLEAIFNSYFKNQIETGTGKGMVDVGSRKKASKDLFGTDIASTSARDYEKYGFLMDKDIVAQGKSGIARQYWSYGDGIQVRFKKDRVITTFTMEDSLCSGLAPSLTTDPRPSSFDSKSIIGSSLKPKSAIECTKAWAYSYIELQYHGDLTLDCIQSIYIPRDVIPKISDSTIALMLKVGCPIYTTDEKDNLIIFTGKKKSGSK